MNPKLRRVLDALRARWPLFAAAAFGLLVFLVQGGAATWNPVDTRWIPAGKDWGYHWVGWLYFRAAPWGFPLGDTPNLLWPVGTTVGFMDGLPWLSTFLKLFAPVLPENFQWVGPYIGACFVLQGWFGARLVAAVTPSRPTAAVGGCLYAIAPVLLNRIRHMALCSHFIILAALTTVVRREERARLAPVLLPAVTMGIHPYLTFIVLGISLAAIVRYRIEGLCTTVGALARLVVMLLLVAAVAAVFGFFMHGGTEVAGRGFGFFNSELLSLVNSQGTSRLLPIVPLRQGQGEGFGFLGTGVIVLGLGAIIVEIRARRLSAPPLPWRRVAPLIVVAVLYAVFSWGSKVSVFGRDIVDLSRLYPAYTGSIFRASGRFIWIAAYMLTTGAVAIWAIRQPRVAPFVLAAVIVLQVADTRSIFFTRRFGGPRKAPVQSPDWQLAAGGYDKMILYPPRCGDGGGVCCEGFTPPPRDEDMYLAVLAVRLGLSYNGFGAGRVARSKHAVYCKAVQTEIGGGHLDPKSIYVVARDREAQFRKANPEAPCKKLDAELVCVAQAATGPFRDKLAR